MSITNPPLRVARVNLYASYGYFEEIPSIEEAIKHVINMPVKSKVGLPRGKFEMMVVLADKDGEDEERSAYRSQERAIKWLERFLPENLST